MLISEVQLEVLLAFAQIGIAFAGFTTIVMIFRTDASHAFTDNDKHRLRIIIEVSLAALIFSLLPIVLVGVATELGFLWRTTGIAASLYMFIRLPSHFQAIIDLHKETPLANGFLAIFLAAMVSSVAAIVVVPEYGAELYISYIFFALVIGAGNFALLVRRRTA